MPYTTDIDWSTSCWSHIDLVGAEIEMLNLKNREKVIKKLLDPIRPKNTIIFSSTVPPSLGLITVNSLTAEDTIIPCSVKYFAWKSAKLLNTIKIIKSKLNLSSK